MLQTIDNTAPELETPRPVKGRPRTTPELDAVLRVYQEHAEGGRLHKSRRERAALLGVSTATLDRLELVLRERGDIVIHTTPDRRGSTVELVGVIKIPLEAADVITPEPVALEPIAMPETVHASHAYARGVTHPSRDSLPVAPPRARRPRLAALVAEGFDLYAGAPLHKRKRRVLHYVAENGGEGYAADFVEAMYDLERDRRTMATWTASRLARTLRSYEQKADDARDGSGDKLWLWQRGARLIRAEMARRPATPGRKPRKNCEALPDPRKAAARRQAELWAVVEPVLAELRGASRPACVPPPPAPVVPPAPEYDATGLIARLYAKKAAPPAAAAE